MRLDTTALTASQHLRSERLVSPEGTTCTDIQRTAVRVLRKRQNSSNSLLSRAKINERQGATTTRVRPQEHGTAEELACNETHAKCVILCHNETGLFLSIFLSMFICIQKSDGVIVRAAVRPTKAIQGRQPNAERLKYRRPRRGKGHDRPSVGGSEREKRHQSADRRSDRTALSSLYMCSPVKIHTTAQLLALYLSHVPCYPFSHPLPILGLPVIAFFSVHSLVLCRNSLNMSDTVFSFFGGVNPSRTARVLPHFFQVGYPQCVCSSEWVESRHVDPFLGRSSTASLGDGNLAVAAGGLAPVSHGDPDAAGGGHLPLREGER